MHMATGLRSDLLRQKADIFLTRATTMNTRERSKRGDRSMSRVVDFVVLLVDVRITFACWATNCLQLYLDSQPPGTTYLDAQPAKK